MSEIVGRLSRTIDARGPDSLWVESRDALVSAYGTIADLHERLATKEVELASRASVPDAATAAIERVRAIHVRDEYGLCAECSWEYPETSYDAIGNEVAWPCPTIQALGDVSSDQNLINPHNHAEIW